MQSIVTNTNGNEASFKRPPFHSTSNSEMSVVNETNDESSTFPRVCQKIPTPKFGATLFHHVSWIPPFTVHRGPGFKAGSSVAVEVSVSVGYKVSTVSAIESGSTACGFHNRDTTVKLKMVTSWPSTRMANEKPISSKLDNSHPRGGVDCIYPPRVDSQ